jgi:Predicted nucleic acid-binding protein, contains PIN domain
MYCVDVNVLINAYVADQRHSDLAFNQLVRLRAGPRELGILPIVATGFLRLTTDPRVLPEPSPIDEALEFLDALLLSRHVHIVDPGPQYWEIFRVLVREHGPVGPDMTDVHIAAAAMSLGAELISFDRGFARFRDLSWNNPARSA